MTEDDECAACVGTGREENHGPDWRTNPSVPCKVCDGTGKPNPAGVDRVTVEKLAGMTRDHLRLLLDQKRTMAVMIRACTARLRSPDSRKRKEAIEALDELAEMLEKEVNR